MLIVLHVLGKLINTWSRQFRVIVKITDVESLRRLYIYVWVVRHRKRILELSPKRIPSTNWTFVKIILWLARTDAWSMNFWWPLHDFLHCIFLGFLNFYLLIYTFSYLSISEILNSIAFFHLYFFRGQLWIDWLNLFLRYFIWTFRSIELLQVCRQGRGCL